MSTPAPWPASKHTGNAKSRNASPGALDGRTTASFSQGKTGPPFTLKPSCGTSASSPRPSGVPEIKLHELRHTHATLGLAAGVPAKVMQDHSSVTITLDFYSHVVPGMQADAAKTIGAVLRRSR